MTNRSDTVHWLGGTSDHADARPKLFVSRWQKDIIASQLYHGPIEKLRNRLRIYRICRATDRGILATP